MLYVVNFPKAICSNLLLFASTRTTSKLLYTKYSRVRSSSSSVWQLRVCEVPSSSKLANESFIFCQGQKPPKRDVKRPACQYKSSIERRFTTETQGWLTGCAKKKGGARTVVNRNASLIILYFSIPFFVMLRSFAIIGLLPRGLPILAALTLSLLRTCRGTWARVTIVQLLTLVIPKLLET